jgi:hypothetical protein
MAGYSGTPLPKKLGIKPGGHFAAIDAPIGFAAALGELPGGVEWVVADDALTDVIVFFTTDAAELKVRFACLSARLAQGGGLWIACPKRASGVPTDLTENTIRDIGLAHGLVDNKVCAIDETWSGLRFVHRRAKCPGRVVSPLHTAAPGARARSKRWLPLQHS